MSPRPQILPPLTPTPTTSDTATSTSESTTTTTTSDTSTSTTSTSTSTSTTSTTSDTSTSTTSDSTSTSTSTSTSSTSASSSTDTSTSTTSTTSATSTSTSLTPTQSTTSAILITSSDGSVATSTTVVVVAPSVSASSATDNGKSSSPKGFFQNTGAVAGVFTVVGLVALVLFIALVTNAVRRRRAKKLDREIAEAAAEAAGTAPAFTDDDYYPDDRLPKGGPSGDVRSMTTGYSDTTHGTFAQPPMSHGESYNMAELSPYDYGAAAGAAGIGAMGVNRARSMGSNNHSTPYNAFATPQPAMPSPYDDPVSAYGQQQNYYRQRGPGAPPEMDLLDAAGLGAAGGAAAGYAAAHQAYGQPQPQNGGNLNRNPSLGPSNATSPSDYSSYGAHPQMPQGYQQDYTGYQQSQPAQYNAYQQGYAPQAAYAAIPPQHQHQAQQQSPETSPSPARPLSSVSAADPYGGYVDEPSDSRGSLPGYSSPPPTQAGAHPPEKLLSGNFASPPASSEGHEHEENRMSYQDGDDYGYEPRRVLKVANE